MRLSYIDPHVHLRGEEYPDHDFLGMALEDAASTGARALIEMPNTTPPLTTVVRTEARQRAVQRAQLHVEQNFEMAHRIHAGMTIGFEQVCEMLCAIKRGETGCYSDKIFYCHSTGNMGITDPDLQKKIWDFKGKIGYSGVSIGHFEDEECYVDKFEPAYPLSHTIHQPGVAELRQVMRQMKFARDAGFVGTFYVAHVSCPDTISFLLDERRTAKFEIAIEMTWHHMLLNTSDYQRHGNRVKMNPPLRSDRDQKLLWGHMLQGHVDVIGSDHAPHPLERKDDKVNPPSGVPALPFWPRGMEILRDCVGDSFVAQKRIDAMTFDNANRLFFDGRLGASFTEGKYNPALWFKYGYNPFERIDENGHPY